MLFHRLDLVGKGIETFKGLKELSSSNFVVVDVSGNSLSSFEHFGTLLYLTELNVQNNRIDSFLGLTKQRSLEVLWLSGNPITAHPYYRVMAILVVGFSLNEIDGIAVSPEERSCARSMGPDAALAVSYGWLMDLHPRSTAMYQEIISECKHLRKARKASKSGARTVEDALIDTQRSRNGGLNSKRHPDSRTGCSRDQEEGESEAAAVRLSKRIAYLEAKVQRLQSGGGLSAAVGENDECTLGRIHRDPYTLKQQFITDSDLRTVESIFFSEGIQVQSNNTIAVPIKQPARAVLRLDRGTLNILTFMTRDIIVEFRLSATQAEFVKPNGLTFRDSFGTAAHVSFTYGDTLAAVYKSFFLLKGQQSVPAIPNSVLSMSQARHRDTPELLPAPVEMQAIAAQSASRPEEHAAILTLEADRVKRKAMLSRAAQQPPHEAKAGASDVRGGIPDKVADILPLPSQKNVSRNSVGSACTINFAFGGGDKSEKVLSGGGMRNSTEIVFESVADPFCATTRDSSLQFQTVDNTDGTVPAVTAGNGLSALVRGEAAQDTNVPGTCRPSQSPMSVPPRRGPRSVAAASTVSSQREGQPPQIPSHRGSPSTSPRAAPLTGSTTPAESVMSMSASFPIGQTPQAQTKPPRDEDHNGIEVPAAQAPSEAAVADSSEGPLAAMRARIKAMMIDSDSDSDV